MEKQIKKNSLGNKYKKVREIDYKQMEKQMEKYIEIYIEKLKRKIDRQLI